MKPKHDFEIGDLLCSIRDQHQYCVRYFEITKIVDDRVVEISASAVDDQQRPVRGAYIGKPARRVASGLTVALTDDNASTFSVARLWLPVNQQLPFGKISNSCVDENPNRTRCGHTTKSFEETFCIENIPQLLPHIQALENEGLFATAIALRSLLQTELSRFPNFADDVFPVIRRHAIVKLENASA
jgi:hypothetical protein